MDLFNRKKKPWDYENRRDKIISIIDDYSKDKKVLKKVIKNDSDYDIKAIALVNYLPSEKFINGVQMMNVLLNEIGLSQQEALKLVETYSNHLEIINKQTWND